MRSTQAWRRRASTTAVLFLASWKVGESFVPHPLNRPTIHDTVKRYSVTILRDQQSPAWPDQSPTGDMTFPKVNAPADFDEWFWGASTTGGVESAVFANDDRAVILFDGVCNFCNEGVNFFMAMDRDPRRGSFRFAAMQGDIGQSLMMVSLDGRRLSLPKATCLMM